MFTKNWWSLKCEEWAKTLTQPAVVFMAPDDQVEEVRDEGLGNVVGGTPLGTVLYTDQPLLIMTSRVKKTILL